MTVATSASCSRVLVTAGFEAYTILLACPAVKKLAAGSRSPLLVSVTLMGFSGSPRAARPARRGAVRTSSRGLSRRMVFASTRMASALARTSSTRSKSASLDSSSRVLVVSSM